MVNEYRLLFDRINIKCKNLKGKITIAHLTDIHLGAIYGRNFIQRWVVKLLLKEYIRLVVKIIRQLELNLIFKR